MFKLLWEKKIAIIVAVLLVVLLPIAMTKESIVLSKTIVTAVGIEKTHDGKYTVYTEVIIFNFDPFGVQEREIHQSTAQTIDEALIEIGVNRGKTISLSHCTIITLDHSLKDENLMELLDVFLQRNDLNNSAVLFWTTSGVEKLMEASIERGDARAGLLQQIAAFNRNRDGFTSTNLELFFKDMLRNQKAKIPLVEVDKEGQLINVDDFRWIYRTKH